LEEEYLKLQREISKKIAALLSYIDEVVEDENRSYGDRELDEMGERTNIDNRQVKSTIKEINKSLEENFSTDPGHHPEDVEPSDPMDEEESLPLEKLAKNSKALKIKFEKVEEQLSNLEPSKTKKARRANQEIQKKLLLKIKSYEQQEIKAGDRSSYSKIDPYATFFRFKNGDLLPAYNVMFGTQNQFFLNYSIHRILRMWAVLFLTWRS
jgi:hypothetical protein